MPYFLKNQLKNTYISRSGPLQTILHRTFCLKCSKTLFKNLFSLLHGHYSSRYGIYSTPMSYVHNEDPCLYWIKNCYTGGLNNVKVCLIIFLDLLFRFCGKYSMVNVTCQVFSHNAAAFSFRWGWRWFGIWMIRAQTWS